MPRRSLAGRVRSRWDRSFASIREDPSHAPDRTPRAARQTQGATRAGTTTGPRSRASARAASGTRPLQSRLAGDPAHAGAQSVGSTVKRGMLRAEVNKRLTLNWLIQGAAEHAGMTIHHLVRDELVAIDPRLIDLYDQFALISRLQYWSSEFILRLGWPPRFWRRAATDPRHPFYRHLLLSRYGGMLAA